MIAPLILAMTYSITPQTRVLVVGRDALVVQCAPRKVCDIALPAEDSVADIAAGDSVKRDPSGWIIDQGVANDSRDGRAYLMLYVSPKSVNGRSNMVVTTGSQHVYQITLDSEPFVTTTSYAVLVPNEDGSVPIVVRPVPRVVAATPTPDPATADLPVNAGYVKVEGNSQLEPTQIIRHATNLELIFNVPTGKTAPSVAALDGDGSLLPINAPTSVDILRNGEVIHYHIFDLDRPIVIYRGIGDKANRLVITL